MKKKAQPGARRFARHALAALLISAGIAHLSWARKSFPAQVPSWVRVDADIVVLLSGVVEIALGVALLGVRARRRQLGWVVACFFVAVFPGNIAQFVAHKDAFGLTSDTRRAVRLLFQPALIAWALWATGNPAGRPGDLRSSHAPGPPTTTDPMGPSSR